MLSEEAKETLEYINQKGLLPFDFNTKKIEAGRVYYDASSSETAGNEQRYRIVKEFKVSVDDGIEVEAFYDDTEEFDRLRYVVSNRLEYIAAGEDTDKYSVYNAGEIK